MSLSIIILVALSFAAYFKGSEVVYGGIASPYTISICKEHCSATAKATDMGTVIFAINILFTIVPIGYVIRLINDNRAEQC